MKKFVRYIILTVILLLVASTHLYRSLDTIQNNQDKFTPHYTLSFGFPFSGKYYLMIPQNYDPEQKYPLVVVLHGVSRHAYAAEYLAKAGFRSKYPVFVMVPIAPTQAFWATPKDPDYRMVKTIPYPDHLPVVMSEIRHAQKKYNIDSDQIIITGHSMGGSGAIGAMQRYPSTFKAAISSSGAWPPNEISKINRRVFVYHGDKDSAVPVQLAQNLKSGATKIRAPINVKIMQGRGHGIGDLIYSDEKIWDKVIK